MELSTRISPVGHGSMFTFWATGLHSFRSERSRPPTLASLRTFAIIPDPHPVRHSAYR